MKDVLQTYKFNFEFNTKDSKKQLKSISEDVLKMLSDMDSASNKMKIFGGLVGYLEKLDVALNQFKSEHKDDFANMFSGLDGQLIKSLESALGLDGNKLGQLSGLRERIDSALVNKAGVKELKVIAQDINSLFTSIGEKEPINIDEWFFGKKKTLEQRIEYLNDQLYDFFMSYQLITNSIKGGFGAGGASGFIALSDDAREEAERIKASIKELNSAKKQLEGAKEVIGKIDKKSSKTPSEYKVDLTVDSVQGLISEFDRLNSEIKSGDSASKEYYDNLVKMSDVVIKLKGALKDIDASSEIKQLFVDSKSGKGDTMFGQLSEYANAKSYNFLQQHLGDSISHNIQNIINQSVQDFAKLIPSVVGDGLKIGSGSSSGKAVSAESQYQQLMSKLNAYKAIVEDFNFDPDDNETADKLIDIKKEIREIFDVSKESKDAFNNLFDSYDELSIDFPEFKSGLMSLLNVFEPIEGGISEAQTKLQEFLNIADTLRDIEYMSDADVDKNIAKLEEMKSGLIELSEQGELTTEDLTKINNAFDKTESHLKSMDHSAYGKLQSEASEFGNEAQESTDEVATGLENVETKTHGVTDAFKELINYISKSGVSPKAFFESLESGARLLDEELSGILLKLNLMDSNGNILFNAVGSGSINSGGMISDQYALISRQKSKYLKYAIESQPKLFEAEKLGANVGTILDIFTDEANDVMYELQKRMSGVGLNDQNHNLNSLDFLKATDEQIKKLIEDLKILQKVGLYVDHNGKNILYDQKDGFSFIDLASKSTWFTANAKELYGEDNSVEENLDLFLTSLFGYNPNGDAQNFMRRVYGLAEEVVGKNIMPDYLKPSQSNVVGDSDAVAASIKAEESAHEQNTEAIKQENKAIQAQIDLKKKAQSMTWENFALDESLSTAKGSAGIISLAEQEKFWKNANYDKDIDFHRLSNEDTDSIISKYFTADERDAWYMGEHFGTKSKIENKILENDELRNAALNHLYNIYKSESSDDTYRVGYANDDAAGFADFLNREFTVYRGDTSPVIYGDEQKLSFSFDPFEASRFSGYDDKYVESTKVVPKYTVGSLATEDYIGEQEIFVSSDKLPYLSGVGQSFKDYYNKLGPKMQQAIDNRFIQLEKDRVKSLLGNDIIHRIENTLPYRPELVDQFKHGGIPDKIELTGDYTMDQFAGEYNDLPEIKKKLAAYYASLYSIDPTQQFRSKTIGAAGLLDAIVSDPLGVQQHVTNLTGESKFNILGQSGDDINAEAEAHKKNAQSMQEESQAQKELNDLKSGYKNVSDKLYEEMNDETWHQGKFTAMANISKGLSDVYDTPEGILAQGDYLSSTTGEVFDISSLIDSINQFEQDWNMSLDYVKDYIQKVSDGFKGQKFEEKIHEIDVKVDDDDDFDYDDIGGTKYSVQDYEDAYKSQSQEAQAAINDLAEFYQEYDALQAKINGAPIDFLISSETPTLEETQKVVDTFEALQNKIKEINNMSLVETEDDEKRLQELQAEAVGLQNTLRSAITVGNNSFSYQSTYGLSLADAIKMNGYINSEDIYSVAQDLEFKWLSKRGAVHGSATPAFNALMFDDASNSLEEFLLKQAKQLQLEKEITAEQQKQDDIADQVDSSNEVAQTQQQLDIEHQITEEKQKQADIVDASQTPDEAPIAQDDDLKNVYDDTDDIQQEAQAHKDNADAILEEVAAQQSANDIKKTGFEIVKDYWRSISNQSEQAVEGNAKNIVNGILDKAFNADPSLRHLNFAKFGDANNVENYTKQYQMFDEVLQLIGYHLGELEPSMIDDQTQWGFSAEIVANSEKVVNNLEEARKILFGINGDVNDGVVNEPKDDTPGSKGKKQTTPDQKADKAIYIGALNQYRSALNKEMKKLDFTSIDQGLSDSQKEIADLYNTTIHQIEQYVAAVKKGESVELDSIQNAIAALKEKSKVYKEQNNLTDSGNKKTKGQTQYGQNVMATLSGKYNTLQSKINGNEYLSDSGVLQAKFNEYEASLTRIRNLYNSLKGINPTAGDKESFKQASAECNNLYKDVEKLIKEYEKLHNDPNKIGEQSLGYDFVDSAENRKQALLDYVQSMHGAKATVGDFTDAWHGLEYTIDNGDGTLVKAKATIDNLGTAIVETAGDTQKAVSKFQKFFGDISDKFRGLWVYTTSRFGVDEIIRIFKDGINYVKEMDSSMTELKKVTDETDESYKQFLQDASAAAAKIGGTPSEFVDATTMFARLGYSMEESSKMAEAAIVYDNVADGINSVEEASESIISTMMAFGVKTEDVMSIVDKFNEVGNRFAITSAGIGEALQRSASALQSSGNTLDEAIALITAANSVVQNPEQVGTALKTLSLRLRGAKTELEDAGEDVEGMAENTSELQKKLLALTHGKVDIMLDADTFKSTTQILREMSAAWKDMTDIERASALELMGGKRQANILSSIITNFDIVEDVIESSANSMGSAMAENEVSLDSIEGKTRQFTGALQTMWNNMINSKVIKGFVDFGTTMVKFLDTGVGKVVALVTAFRLLSKIKKINVLDMLKGFGGSVKEAFGKVNVFGALGSLKNIMMPQGDAVGEPVLNYVQQCASAVKNLTPSMQAAMLAAKGLNDEQIKLALTTNGVSEAEASAILSSTALNNVKRASVTLTKQQTQDLIASNGAKLSEAATNFLLQHSEEEINEEMLERAVLDGVIDANTKKQIMSALGLTGANMSLAASFKAIGVAIKTMIASNPVGFLLSLATTVLSLIPIFDAFGEGEDKVERSAEEIGQSIQSIVSECQNLKRELKDLQSSANNVIPRFVDLSEGVDRFGKNISLTDEEYAEFLDLNNKIAEMFPQIDMGLDENGNHMLSLSGSADVLSASLWDLVEAERELANQEIAKQIPQLVSETNSFKSARMQKINDLKSKVQILKSGKFISDIDDIYYVNWISDIANNSGVKVETGMEVVGKGLGRHAAAKYSFDPNSKAVQNLIAGYEKQINNMQSEIETEYKNINPVIASWIQTDSKFQELDHEMQNIALSFVNGLDFSDLGLSTEKQIEDYITNKIITPLSKAVPEVKEAFKELMLLDPNSMTAEEYKVETDRLIKIIAASDGDDGAFTMPGLKDAFGINDTLADYSSTANQIVKAMTGVANAGSLDLSNILGGLTGDLDKESLKNAKGLFDQLITMSAGDLQKAYKLVTEYGIDSYEDLQKYMDMNIIDLSINVDTEKKELEELQNAIEESTSATGLSAESVSKLTARYRDLEGFDPARLFENTANGVHLNTQELMALEKEYANMNKKDIDDKLKGLTELYNDLTIKISNCSNVSERANLYAQRDNVQDQINDTVTLASKYDALTSAYYRWQQAQSNGNERDMYEAIISGRERVEKLLSQGWVDDEVRAYVDLLSGKDLSTASYDEIIAEWNRLNKEIGDSGYTIHDFFTVDEDGNSTVDGIYNFFDTVRSVMGEQYAWIDKETGKYHLNFTSDEEAAAALGIDIEALQAILKAMSDAGFEVEIKSDYSALTDLKTEAEKANDKLIELGVTSRNFAFGSTDIAVLESDIEEARQALNQFTKEDGTIDITLDGAQEAQDVLAALLQAKYLLRHKTILSFDVSGINDASSDAEKMLSNIQGLVDAYIGYTINFQVGADEETIAKSKEKMLEYYNYLIGLFANNPELESALMVKLGFDGKSLKDISPETLANAMANIDSSVILELVPDAKQIEGYDPNIDALVNYGIDKKSEALKYNWDRNAKIYYTPQAKGNGVLQFLWGDGKVDGTANVAGTAFSKGSWGAPRTETALVGELGPEILVRNGRWQTIGDNGAEFTQVKKGDIIFNHRQTEELLKNGRITGRGKSYAGGTAYALDRGPGSAIGVVPTGAKNDSLFSKFATTAASVVANTIAKVAETTVNAGSNAGGGTSRQDATSTRKNSSVKGGNSGSSGGSSGASDEFEEVFDWIEVRLEEIQEKIDLKSAKLENAIGHSKQNDLIDGIIEDNKTLRKNLLDAEKEYSDYAATLLSKVDADYREIAQNGNIDIEVFKDKVGEEQLKAIQEYRDWVQKGADVTQQAEETITEISSLAKQAIDNISEDYDNKKSLSDNKIDQYEAYNELLETTKGFASEAIYQSIVDANNDSLPMLENKRNEMLAELNKRVESGDIKKYSQDWYDAVNDIAAVDTEIVQLKTDTANYQDDINDLHWDKFDALMSRIEAISNETENMIDILGSEDLVDEVGNWTDEGIASLGLYAQKMEAAEVQAKKYEEEIDYLNNNWQKLGYTEEEYIEKLGELKDGQYDAIKAYNDTKDAIVDLNKERVDAIKDGIQQEIDAYSELIEKKKEELDSEKDLYDFQKSTMEQEKDIADIQRQLAALSADNSASARAKRAQLEADLAESQQKLQDSYYDRSISKQQEALDKELESFQEEKDAEIEGWEKYLEDTNKVVADSLAIVQANTDTVFQTLQNMAQEYGLNIQNAITSAIIDPWSEGTTAIQAFSESFGISMSATIDELNELEVKFSETMASIEKSGSEASNTVNTSANKYTSAEYVEPPKVETPTTSAPSTPSTPSTAGMVSDISGTIYYGQTGDRVKKLQQALNALGFNCGKVDGKFGPQTLSAVKKFQNAMGITVDGRVGPQTKGKFKAKGYAVGSTGVKEDQLAFIDELGPELQLVPGNNGRLEYIKKGTGIVPADMTERLMNMAMDPQMMIDNNRPSIGVHKEIHNTQIQIDSSIGELIHIDKCDQGTLPDVERIVNKALDKHMQNLNQSLRKFTR